MPLQLALVSPVELPYTPGGQAEQLAFEAPPVEKDPAAQASELALQEPAGQ